MEPKNDQYSIKNLLFTKAIPNYVIPVPTAGHRVFACLDCGDKFMMESSLQYHINRMSLKISFLCRLCNKANVFYNRCNLLAHIRGHTFKTATINVTDLKVEPLPLTFYKKLVQNSNKITENEKERCNNKNMKSITNSVLKRPVETCSVASCNECQESIPWDGIPKNILVERTKHYMKLTNETFTCPVCMFTLPTKCAYKAHLRFHCNIPPFICPECGYTIRCARGKRNSNFPFPFVSHDCEGFQMMRTSARVKCPKTDCHLLTVSEYKDHLRVAHLKELYKCSYCFFACTDKSGIQKHIEQKHHSEEPPARTIPFYQCQICSRNVGFSDEQAIDHMKDHTQYLFVLVFPCWVCGVVFNKVLELIEHQAKVHGTAKEVQECLEEIFKSENMRILNKPDTSKKTRILSKKDQNMYGVVKRCGQCLRSFSYRCCFEEIGSLPNDCPYKCSGPAVATEQLITCHICKSKISQNWDDIKQHYTEYHKSHRCLDVQVPVTRINIEKYIKNANRKTIKNTIKKRTNRRKRTKRVQINVEPDQQGTIKKSLNKFACRKCSQEYENKELLEKHLIVHRDLYMAYQCMECGQSFVVKPSFSKHLLLEHNITNVDEYIDEKKCYNEDALQKYQDQPMVNDPLQENQCKICRLQFDNSEDLEKHFRVHGMAFLMKNNSSKNSS